MSDRSRTPRRLLAATLTLALFAGAGACSDDDGDDAETTASTTSSTAAGGSGTTGESTTTSAGSGSGGSGTGASTTAATGATGPTTTATPSGGESTGVIELTIVGGNVEGGVRREKVKTGAQVTLRVTSDVADELHVHTYDQKIDLVPGQSSDLTFLARIPGVFEVELEGRGKKVLELEVSG